MNVLNHKVLPLCLGLFLTACGARDDSKTIDMSSVDPTPDVSQSAQDAEPEPDARSVADAQPTMDSAPQPVADAAAPGTQPIVDAAAPGTQPTGPVADVVQVAVRGEPGAYTFSVTIRSPDTGCEQYANWWEVLDADGNLIYRRILGHSHVGEQPFTRSGGPVDVAADTTVWVRAHMNATGYGGVSRRGQPNGEFATMPFPNNLPSVENHAPQPNGCAF